MPADTRERIVGAAADLLKKQGLVGTGIKQIAAASGTQLGSLYHFFPGGKDELAADALRTAGRSYLYLLDEFFSNVTDPVQAVRDFYAAGAAVLEATDYADACPIATVALEVASTNEPLREVTAEVFEEWITVGTARFVELGAGPAEARAFVIQLIAALEGGFLLCRAAKSTEAMKAIGDLMADAVSRVHLRNS